MAAHDKSDWYLYVALQPGVHSGTESDLRQSFLERRAVCNDDLICGNSAAGFV